MCVSNRYMISNLSHTITFKSLFSFSNGLSSLLFSTDILFGMRVTWIIAILDELKLLRIGKCLYISYYIQIFNLFSAFNIILFIAFNCKVGKDQNLNKVKY